MNVSKNIIKLPTFLDSRGNLTLYDKVSDSLPFLAERLFWISNVPQGQVRGLHAHKTCSEILIAVNGSVSVTLTDKNGSQTYLLDQPNKGLIIHPYVWCKLDNFSTDCVCLCLASEAYDETGYINDWEEFQEIINHK